MTFLANRADIALLKLSQPVTNIKPIRIYNEDDLIGKTITIYGRGATGTGLSGEDQSTKIDQVLRYCHNIVESAPGHWVAYIFDLPGSGLPLEGMHGSGDSGGPSIIFVGSEPFLVGLSSWQYFDGELEEMKSSIYGTQAFQIRASAFSEWIKDIIDAH